MGYPTSVTSFTTKNAGDAIQPAHVNDLQTEVAAVETGLLNGLSHPLTVNAGLAFPAAQAASSGANTLDDYEEGSWTPVIGGSGGTSGQTYAVNGQVGRYIKIGKQVTAWFYAELTAKGTITTVVQIQGFPFTSENTTSLYSSAALVFQNLATNWVNVTIVMNPNAVVAAVQGAAAAGGGNVTALVTADIGNTTAFIGTLMYRASA